MTSYPARIPWRGENDMTKKLKVTNRTKRLMGEPIDDKFKKKYISDETKEEFRNKSDELISESTERWSKFLDFLRDNNELFHDRAVQSLAKDIRRNLEIIDDLYEMMADHVNLRKP
jgi:hypothetical protein